MEQFQVGECVRLRSAGPKMMVKALCDNNTVLCVWFDAHGHTRDAYFPTNLLVRIPHDSYT